MRFIPLITTLLLLIGIAANPALAENQGNVLLKSTAEVEMTTKDPDGKEIIVRKPATKVLPDTEVIYTNTFSNIGAEPAENIRLDNPIPEHTVYVAGSAFGEDTEITFSVDGGQLFENPKNLTVPGPDGKPRPATAADYTHIRWVRAAPLQPGEEAHAGFSVQLE
ncbi:hypothetical protein P9J64_14810 [Deltaproteobacteria bacterium IMCC39524]|nr:hypothetical protein [Deltaproteobacteria bacterium IMCC39524]